jgi:chromosome segregation ATPase
MDTRKNKRKRENPIKIENMEEYLKDLGVFDDLLRLERREFNDLMDDILLTNKQKTKVRKIRRLFKNREYVRIRRNQHKKDLIEFNDKMAELKNEIKLYKEKNNELETKNQLYKKKIDKLEVKNSSLEIRVDLKKEQNEEPFDFNTHFNL